jgi:hypothetical protein
MSYLESILIFANDKAVEQKNPSIFTIDQINDTEVFLKKYQLKDQCLKLSKKGRKLSSNKSL